MDATLPQIPEELLALAARWPELKRWERKELAQALRRLGLAYREIGMIIPVGKGTLSPWCRDIPLTAEQLERITRISGGRAAGREKAGAILRQRNVIRTSKIREAAKAEVPLLLQDPFWTAGLVAYWAEGAKTCNRVVFVNSDPAMVRLFTLWSRTFLGATTQDLQISLHIHAGQDDCEIKQFWSNETRIPLDQFRKSFVKAEGTGHRKNVLYHGTARIDLRRSTDRFHRIIGWIDGYVELLFDEPPIGSATICTSGR